jgi:hypothetical protein
MSPAKILKLQHTLQTISVVVMALSTVLGYAANAIPLLIASKSIGFKNSRRV